MSNQELDKLFKNKLEDLKVQPSADAWSKIQKNSKEKQSSALFIKVAAAVVILAVFAGILWINNDEHRQNNTVAINNHPVAKKKENAQNKETKADSEPHDVVQADKNKEQHNIKPSGTEPVNKESEFTEQIAISKKNKEDRKVQSLTKKELANHPPASNSKLQETTDKETKNQDAETKNQKPEIRNQKPETRTLTFNIEQFASAKISGQEQGENQMIADADSQQKTTLKKVIGFAQDLKEGNDGLGELREVKNELFAFNFKNRNENSN